LEDIGKKVQQLREANGWSLQELARRTGLSASFLSQLERGRCSVSITTLDRVATELGVTIGFFFPQVKNGRNRTTAAERVVIQASGSLLSYEKLSGDFPGRIMEAFLITMQPGEMQDTPYRHEGEEFGFILEGTLTMAIDNETVELHPGDSVHFQSTQPHTWENRGDRPVRAVWVNTHIVT
jgi:transcriptional regulator with XRE-family HTH domain